MKYPIILALFLVVSPLPCHADMMCRPLQTCAAKHVQELDDKISSAEAVATHLMSSVCAPETQECIHEANTVSYEGALEEATESGALKNAPHMAEEIKAEINSPASLEKTRSFIARDLLAPRIRINRNN